MTADAAAQSGHEIPDALSQIPLPRDASFDSGPYQRHGIWDDPRKGGRRGRKDRAERELPRIRSDANNRNSSRQEQR
jgi:hypothetical protein